MQLSNDGNIILDISNEFKGKGLSHVIDHALELELNAIDQVNMNSTEWNSIFSLIKANQVTTNTNQFGEDDTDVENNSHYEVTLGAKYEIKKSVWDKIVDIAQKHLNAQKAQVTEQTINTNVADTKKPAATDYSKEVKAISLNGNETDIHGEQGKKDILKVEEILEKSGFDTSSADRKLINDLVKKYHVMQAVNPDIEKDEIQRRLVNYANAKKFEKFEHGSEKGTVNTNLSTKASEVKTNFSDQRLAYLDMGAEYVEGFDQDGNEEIGLHEMFYHDLVEYYQNEKGLTQKQARQYAIEVVQKYKDYNLNTTINYDNVESADLYKATLFNNAVRKIKSLDIDGNGTVSGGESATYLYGMAHINDNSNKITSEESRWANLIIQTKGMTKKQIMETLDFDANLAQKLLDEQEKFFEYRTDYKSFIIDGNIPK